MYKYIGRLSNKNIEFSFISKECCPGIGRLMYHGFNQVDIVDCDTGEVMWNTYASPTFYTPCAPVDEIIRDVLATDD